MDSPSILVLAGGRATRMGGGDKALRPFAGATLLDHVLARLGAQGGDGRGDRRGDRRGRILLNANGDPARFARFGLPVIADTMADHCGPLAGVLAGMEWVRAHAPQEADLVTVPTDTPFLPEDLIERLLGGRDEAGAELACAASGGRAHPLAALWPVRLAPLLRRALHEEGLRRVDGWTQRFSRAEIVFPVEPVDPFFNVNTPADLVAAATCHAAKLDGAGPSVHWR